MASPDQDESDGYSTDKDRQREMREVESFKTIHINEMKGKDEPKTPLGISGHLRRKADSRRQVKPNEGRNNDGPVTSRCTESAESKIGLHSRTMASSQRLENGVYIPKELGSDVEASQLTSSNDPTDQEGVKQLRPITSQAPCDNEGCLNSTLTSSTVFHCSLASSQSSCSTCSSLSSNKATLGGTPQRGFLALCPVEGIPQASQTGRVCNVTLDDYAALLRKGSK